MRFRLRVLVSTIVAVVCAGSPTWAQLPAGPDPVVDVLFLYSDEARAYLETAGGLESSVTAAVERVNAILAASQARARIRHVGTERIYLHPSFTPEAAVSVISSTNSEGRARRDAAHADIVFAMLPWTGVIDRCEAVVALEAYDLRGAERSFVGAGPGVCGFPQAVLRMLGVGTLPGAGDAARPYGYGHVIEADGNAHATIMASEACWLDCVAMTPERLSSPLDSYRGVPIGDAIRADARRAVDEAALVVSSYRGCSYQVTAPSSVQVPATGASYPMSITTATSCLSGVPEVDDAWVKATPDDVLRRGSASFVLEVAPNPTYVSRSTLVQVGNSTVSIAQAARNDGQCTTAQVRPTQITAVGPTGRVELEYLAAEDCEIVREAPYYIAGQRYTSRGPTGWRGQGDRWVAVSYELGRNDSTSTYVLDTTFSGALVQVTQPPGSCEPTGTPTPWRYSFEASDVSGHVSLPSGCVWSVSGPPAWVTVLSPTSGTGSVSLYLRAARNNGAARSGSLLIHTGGNTYPLPIYQGAEHCQAQLSAPSFPGAGGAFSSDVFFWTGEQNCAWSISNLSSWATVSPSSGGGPMPVTVGVQANTGGPRQATISINGSPVDLWQAAQHPCPIEQDLPQGIWGPSGGVGRVDVRTRADCTWYKPWHDWIQPVEPGVGTGPGWYSIVVEPNPGHDRTTEFAPGPGLDPVTITQAGLLGPFPSGSCVAGHVSASAVAAIGGSVVLDVRVGPACSWDIATSEPWLILLTSQLRHRAGDATIPVYAAPNTSGVTRVGRISLNGETLSITQPSLFGCDFTPTSATAPPGGGETNLWVATRRSCVWTVPSDTGVPWLTVTDPGASRIGPTSVVMTAQPNTSGRARVATVAVTGSTVTVEQFPDPACRLSFIPASATVPSAGADLDVLFTMGGQCPWSAQPGASWLTLTGLTQGTGAGRVRVRVDASTFELARVAWVVVNGQTFLVNQEAFLPSAPARQFLAEGATGAFFDTNIALLNHYVVPITATLTFLRSGQPPVTHSVRIPARSRADVRPGDLPGLAQAEFSTVIDSERPIAVDRSMTWSSGNGSHGESGITSPGLTWYLAEGATMGGFNLFYLLQNPNAVDADVTITFLRGGGLPPLLKSYVVPANSRQNVWVDIEQFETPDGQAPLLTAAEVSGVVESTNGVPIIVERAMYLDRPGQPFAAGHNSAGITSPAVRWFLAEGATGTFFDLFVLIANPTDELARVTVTYLRAVGDPLTKSYDVPARSRFNIWVDEEHFDGLGKALADAAVSMTLTSDNGVPIVVERAMWWPGGGDNWYEAHNSRGATETGTRWAIADGTRDTATGTETFVLVANTSDHEANVHATHLFDDGMAVITFLRLAPRSRGNMPVPIVNNGGRPMRYGVVVESHDIGDGRVAQIVVERATYRNANGVQWAAGANSLATRLDH